MSWFEAVIRGGDAEAFRALKDAGLRPNGPPLNEATGEPVLNYVFAFVEAEQAGEAGLRVAAALPTDGGPYVIEQINRLGA